MRVTHVMADGTVKEDLTGHRIADKEFYHLLKRILEEQNNEKKSND